MLLQNVANHNLKNKDLYLPDPQRRLASPGLICSRPRFERTLGLKKRFMYLGSCTSVALEWLNVIRCHA